MTPEEIKRKREREIQEILKKRAEAEMAIFDWLPVSLREIVRERDVHPSVVRDALLRGVSEATIIERLNRSQKND